MSALTTWTVKDLRRLKTVLENTPVDDINAIHEQLPDKSEEKIKDLIAKLRNSRGTDKSRTTEAPIESWLSLATQLVFRDSTDHSENLSRAMLLISEYEDFNTNNEEFKPDYKLIYKYLAEILKGGDNLPTLQSVECAIVLDLMHSLADVLKNKSTAVHERIMQWKYRLLTTKVDVNYRSLQNELYKKALTNDFSDLLCPKVTEPAKLVVVRKPEMKRKAPSTSNSGTQANLDDDDDDDGNPEILEEIKQPGNCEQEDVPFKKPKFLTLNPFCIPVPLLKLDEIKKKPT